MVLNLVGALVKINKRVQEGKYQRRYRVVLQVVSGGVRWYQAISEVVKGQV